MYKIFQLYKTVKFYIIYCSSYLRAIFYVLYHQGMRNFHHNTKIRISEIKTIEKSCKIIKDMYKKEYHPKKIKKEILDL